MDEVDHLIYKLWYDHSRWSKATFGPDPGEVHARTDYPPRGPVGALEHLKLEAQEAIEKPDDIMEYADCLLLLMDATRRAGFDLHELLCATATKLAINKKRKYPKPSGDEPTFHVKSCREG